MSPSSSSSAHLRAVDPQTEMIALAARGSAPVIEVRTPSIPLTQDPISFYWSGKSFTHEGTCLVTYECGICHDTWKETPLEIAARMLIHTDTHAPKQK